LAQAAVVIQVFRKFKELDVKTVLFSVIVLLVGFLAMPILAGDGPAVPAVPAVSAATTAPATAPADAAKVVATVGTAKIMAGAVKARWSEEAAGLAKSKGLEGPADLEPKDRELIKKLVLSDLCFTELKNQYFASKHVACSDDEVAAKKKDIEAAALKQGLTVADADAFIKVKLPDAVLREGVMGEKVMAAATTTDKVDSFIKANPAYFNGTKVKASHILINCDMAAPTADQKAAIAKLEKISADIKAGKISFEQAAEDNSDCPSKKQGGDLGEFTFDKMVEPFSEAVFAMKVGEISGVVRSQFGFHIIKLTARTEGKDAPGAAAADVAKKTLGGQLQDELLAMPLKDTPIVVNQ
jgi:peptidyl-prolyl cis-trans isomerase C